MALSKQDVSRILRKKGISGKHAGEYANLLDLAIRKGWSRAELHNQISNSKVFKKSHPGIHDEAGNLKMTPDEYKAQKNAYNQAAHSMGLHNLSGDQIGELIQKDVSAQELGDRLEAIKRIQEYKPALQQFKLALESRGIDTKDLNLNNNEKLGDFILGLGPKRFYSIWENTQVGTAAYNAGADIKAPGQKFISKLVPGQMSESELQNKFASMAQHIQKTMPLSRIYGHKLSKRDLAVLEFGGRNKHGLNQAQIGERVERILATAQAFETEKRGAYETKAGGRGTGQQNQ